MTQAQKQTAAVGVAEHGNSAILVTVTADGRLLDRRRIDLTHGLPTHPYHHEGSWAVGRYVDSPWARKISLPDAIALVARVDEAAAAAARGWTVCWYDRDSVLSDAAAALGTADIDAFLRAMGQSVGPPWQAKHKLAAAGAIAAGGRD